VNGTDFTGTRFQSNPLNADTRPQTVNSVRYRITSARMSKKPTLACQETNERIQFDSIRLPLKPELTGW